MYLFTTEQKDLNPNDKEISKALWLDNDSAVEKLTHKKDKEFLLNVLDDIKSLNV